MPVTGLLFLAGTTAICALPPLNGSSPELLINLGMLDGIASGQRRTASAAGLAALALIGGLVVLAFTKLYGTVFSASPRTHEVAESSEVDTFRIAAMALPPAGILSWGCSPGGRLGRDPCRGLFLSALRPTPPTAACRRSPPRDARPGF